LPQISTKSRWKLHHSLVDFRLSPRYPLAIGRSDIATTCLENV
jgi:hypothetical protein